MTDPQTCADFGGRRSNGQPCGRRAGFGTSHPGHGKCKSHGGNVPGAAAKSERALADDMARVWIGQVVDAPPIDNPLRALAILAGECWAWKDVCSQRLRTLESVGYEGVTGEQVRADVVVWERALDRCNAVLAGIARLKIDERLAQIERDKADQVMRAVEAALKAGQVAPERLPLARRMAAAQLRVIEGDAV